MRLFRRSVEKEAADRWRRINAEKAAAGCRCGRPATNVTYTGGTVGGVPHESHHCDEHRDVRTWFNVLGQEDRWVPGVFDDAEQVWKPSRS